MKEIEDLLQAYRNGLVKSSVPDIIKLYTEDALLMAQTFPIVSGKDNIETWYTKCFELIHLNVTFDIKEVVVTSDEFAFATTTSAGVSCSIQSNSSRDGRSVFQPKLGCPGFVGISFRDSTRDKKRSWAPQLKLMHVLTDT